MKQIIRVLILSIFSIHSFAQQGIKVVVRDGETKQAVAGALISLTKGRVAQTNANGIALLTKAENDSVCSVAFLGYTTSTILLSSKDTIRVVELQRDTKRIQEIEIKATTTTSEASRMQAVSLKPIEIEKIPSLLGESDILRALAQSTTGVKQLDGTQGMIVRGGSIDQNLLYLDDAVIYNASHLLGFYSVFNTQSIAKADMFTGAIPSRFGGRLSSVLDIEMSGGSDDSCQRHLSLGLLAANAAIKGPIKKDTCSFAITARRTYIDKLVLPFVSKYSNNKDFANTNYYFQDFTAKFVWKPTINNKLELSAYYGNDAFNIKDDNNQWENSVLWGNAAISLRWRHRFNSTLSLNQSLSYSRYTFEYNALQQLYKLNLKTSIQTIRYTKNFIYKHNKTNLLVGLEANYHIIRPNDITAHVKDYALNMGSKAQLNAIDVSQHAEWQYDFNEKWQSSIGIRISEFAHLGPFSEYNSQFDSSLYTNGEIISYYIRPEPRAILKYRISQQNAISASVCRTVQYLHFVSIFSSALPAEIWLPSTNNLLPQTAWQYSLAYEYTNKLFKAGITTYYKPMTNVAEPRSSSFSLYGNQQNYTNLLYIGKGTAWGVECSIQKTTGRVTGSLSYCYSRSMRQFDDINNGIAFPAKYDRPHDITLNMQYQLSKRIKLMGGFSYYSGINTSMPIARYLIQGNVINQYGEKNAYRFPAYHRADVAITYTIKNTNKWKSELNFSVSNIYNHLNPYYIYYDVKGNISDYQLSIDKREVYLFPILPSITWSIDF